MAARQNKGGLHHFTPQEAQNLSLGQGGSMIIDGTSNDMTPPPGCVFVAITALVNATFDAAGGLVAVDSDRYINTEAASSAGGGTNGVEMDASNSLPQGMTIYGRWTSINLAGGEIIAYVGN